jgi:Glycosyl hydrolases family 38 C-terminal domain.
MVLRCALVLLLACGFAVCEVANGRAADLYLMNDNHTDYGWNATVEQVEDAMVTELDYYLDQIDQTAGLGPDLRAKYAADSWWYLYVYRQRRTAQQFNRLLDAVRAGSITFPLNPLVELYGAMSTEAAIRAGYWPGRMQRLYQIKFLRAQSMENATLPWGLASIWRNSNAEYVWHGICACITDAPYADWTTPLFRWQGPDKMEMLFKRYPFENRTTNLGGYAEARENLTLARLGRIVNRTDLAPSGVPLIGVFGLGWDDVMSLSQTPYDVARQWAAQTPPSPHRVIVSNGEDFFQALQPYAPQLPQLQGGWGLDWDLWVSALTAPTTAARNSIERLRTTEMLAALATLASPGLWASLQPHLEAGTIDQMRYFEHSWGTVDGVLLDELIANKRAWAASLGTAIADAEAAIAPVLAARFSTSNESRLAVFNPLGFVRTDVADFPLLAATPYVVTDVATGAEVPSQVMTTDDGPVLRFLARDVPSLGYRVYAYRPGTPTAYTRPAAIGAANLTTATLENDDFRVSTDATGAIASLLDKRTGRELAGAGLNALPRGEVNGTTLTNVGPVSATLNLTINGTPNRRVALTLFDRVDRLEIDDRIVDYHVPATGLYHYRFAFNVADPDIRFEEVGAIARPGLRTEGGNFLPGSRTQYMTLNHFVSVIDGPYAVTLSNWDSFAMRIGNSSVDTFDLSSADISVFAVGNPYTPGIDFTNIRRQAGDRNFRHRFAIFTRSGNYSAAEAMRGSLAHQNPLYVLPLPRNNAGPWTEPTRSFLVIDKPNAVVFAFKPAEEEERGLMVRVWELEGRSTSFTIDATPFHPQKAYRATLNENNVGLRSVVDGVMQDGWVGANMLRTYRIVPTVVN